MNIFSGFGCKVTKKMVNNNLFLLFLPFTTKKGCILCLQPKKVVIDNKKRSKQKKPYSICPHQYTSQRTGQTLLAYGDGFYLSAMPATDGDVVIVEVLLQQSALRTLGGGEDGMRSNVVSQYREQQRIFAVAMNQVEVVHQIEMEQQVTLFFSKSP